MDATDGPLKVVVRVSRRRSYNPIYWVNNILQILLKNKGYRESIEGTPNTSISNNRSTTNSNKLIKVEALEGAIIIAIDAVMVLQQRGLVEIVDIKTEYIGVTSRVTGLEGVKKTYIGITIRGTM